MKHREYLLILVASTLLVATPALGKTVVCPGPTIVPGIDVSYWQGTIDWAKVKASGKKYAIIRAAHGLAADTKFAYNWKECHAKGLICGVYHYLQPELDISAQADLMLKTMGKLEPGDLAPVLDVESKGGKTPAQIVAAVDQWMDLVVKATGRTPIIYTGAYFWEDNVKSSAFLSHPLWHAQYCTECCPNIASPWKQWHFWQHSSTGSVSGIAGNVDLDKWNGTEAALAAFAGAATCTAQCAGTTLTKADCSKVDCAVSDGLCVNDSLGARCVSKLCPAKGEATVCPPTPGNTALGTCKDGKLTTGDCSAYAAFCSTVAGPQAKCVSSFCAKSPTDAPVAKDVCLPDGVRHACEADGDLVKKPCPAGTDCKTVSGAAVCQAPTCTPKCLGGTLTGADCKVTACDALPAPYTGWCVNDAKGPRCVPGACKTTGKQSFCLKDAKPASLATCLDGQLTVAVCPTGETQCVPTAKGAACAAAVCVVDPQKPLMAHDLCLPDGTLMHCDGEGQATGSACPDGQKCLPGVEPAGCKPDAQLADAGGDASAADAADTTQEPADAAGDVTATGEDALLPGDAAAETATSDGHPDTASLDELASDGSGVGGPEDEQASDGSGVGGPEDGQGADVAAAAVLGPPAGGCSAGTTGSACGVGWLIALTVAWVARRRRRLAG